MLTQEELEMIVNLLDDHVKDCELFDCSEEKAETLHLIERLKEENQHE